MESWLKRTVWGSGREGMTDAQGKEVKISMKTRPGKQMIHPINKGILEPVTVNGIKCWCAGSYVMGLVRPAVIYKA